MRIDENDIAVSIVIPVFNKEKYIRETMESIISQTLTNIEIIIIDDRSTDLSIKIISSFQMDPRVKIIKNDMNRGAGFSRNRGIEQCRGKYIYFFDADDILRQDSLQILFELAESEQLDFIHFACTKSFFNNDKEVLSIDSPSLIAGIRNKVFDSDEVYQYAMLFSGSTITKFVSREFLLKNGIRFQEIENANDVYFTKMCYVYSTKMTYYTEPLVRYRLGVKGQLVSKQKASIINLLKAVNKVKDETKDKDIYKSIEKSLITFGVSEVVKRINTISENELYSISDNLVDELSHLIGDGECEDIYLNHYMPEMVKTIFSVYAEKKRVEKIEEFSYIMKFESQKIADMMEYIDRFGYKLTIWGMGIHGCQLYEALNANKIYVEKLVDINFDCVELDNVMSPEILRDDKNFILVAFQGTVASVIEEAHRLNKDNIVFDFQSCFSYGVSFEKAIFDVASSDRK